jgi:hypothetical protein
MERMKNESIDLNENEEGLCIEPEYHSFSVVPLLWGKMKDAHNGIYEKQNELVYESSVSTSYGISILTIKANVSTVCEGKPRCIKHSCRPVWFFCLEKTLRKRTHRSIEGLDV